MLEVRCSGTPREIGLAHGQQARTQIRGSIAFYRQQFQETCDLDWPAVQDEAERYVAPLTRLAPRHLDEIRGIAEGSGVDFLDVLALNVRTEITFGLFTDGSSTFGVTAAGDGEIPETDGCTSLSWFSGTDQEHQGTSSPKMSSFSYLAQNWDWMPAQRANLVILYIDHTSSSSLPDTHPLPTIATVTEAGLLAKTGLNSAGVGVCLNALRCRGVDRNRLPVHLALRRALECGSRADAVRALRETGLAGCGHILVADAATGGVGLECTSRWVRALGMDDAGRTHHTNHLLLLGREGGDEKDVEDATWLADSRPRLARVKELTAGIMMSDRGAQAEGAPRPSTKSLFEVLSDEQGYPASINRRQELPGVKTETLFTIVMDLATRRAQVTFGRPTEFTEETLLSL
ncbi:isopenicillin-N n-acyltransferase [Apiospora phragmitis]|uniref:Isopenicillin-N n-acyltransferase n=1 Tax=Apiospora phragmitis TaxID=2905665 RepID=A0ABR1VD32_9PEZI